MRLIDADLFKEKFTGQYEFMQRVIDDEPTVDPVKHGRWIKPVFGDGENHCSACKALQPWTWGEGYHEYDFCPYCGVKMDME